MRREAKGEKEREREGGREGGREGEGEREGGREGGRETQSEKIAAGVRACGQEDLALRAGAERGLHLVRLAEVRRTAGRTESVQAAPRRFAFARTKTWSDVEVSPQRFEVCIGEITHGGR